MKKKFIFVEVMKCEIWYNVFSEWYNVWCGSFFSLRSCMNCFVCYNFIWGDFLYFFKNINCFV